MVIELRPVLVPGRGSEMDRPSKWAIGLTTALVFFGFVWFNVAVMRYRPVSVTPLFLVSLILGLPSAALYYWAVRKSFLKSVRRNQVLNIVRVLSLAAWVMLGYGAAVWVNGSMDMHEPERHVALVLDTAARKTKNSTSYLVTVESWKNDGERIELTVRQRIYRAAIVGQTRLSILTRRGALGHEWIRSIAIAED